MNMNSGFYRSVPRNNPPSISSSHLEKKLDKIFDKAGDGTRQPDAYLERKGRENFRFYYKSGE